MSTDGYPRVVWMGNVNGKVHRIVFFLTRGFYPPVVRHSCDNPLCIKPEHLLPGTASDNMKDRSERGRTHKHVSPEEVNRVLELRSGKFTMKKIADQLQIARKRVEYILNRYAGG